MKKTNIYKEFVEDISQYECGHYTCIDGQHKVCGAGKLKKVIKVRLYGKLLGKCSKCNPSIYGETECKSFTETF